MPSSTLIFQRDGTILVTAGDGLHRVLGAVRRCAQLREIVAGNYVFVLSPAALWGSAERGCSASDIIADLERLSTMPAPAAFAASVADTMGRYGAIEIVDGASGMRLVARSSSILSEIGVPPIVDGATALDLDAHGVAEVKIAAARVGWPIVDRRRIVTRSSSIGLAPGLRLRPYQSEALAPFERGRNGVVLLPCGAGKTIVGIRAAAVAGGPVLVLVPSKTVGQQWQSAFRSMTDCGPRDIGWSGDPPGGYSVTLATYHAATAGKAAGEISGRRWRLVIYDEAQSLPADVFRLAADLDADRRLGLSATLVREDGREMEVFALVGPTLYEATWIELERDGWIAPARCIEVRVPAATGDTDRLRYKIAVVDRLLSLHQAEQVLVVGTDVASLRATGRRLGFPVLTGSTSLEHRSCVFAAFREGVVKTLGVSRIGSVGIDLPDASVLVQISGTFGSRQEEAQRLGRILRPAEGKSASFYTIVAEGTREPYFAGRRQRFLVNQGYAYEIIDASTLPRESRAAQ